MSEAFAWTQKEWMKKNPDADLDSAIAKFKDALTEYGRGEKWVQKALEDAGFISPTPRSNEMALLSFAGQQAAMMQERGEKYAIREYVKNGKTFYYVQATRKVITGKDPNKWAEQIEGYINSTIRGGKDKKVKAGGREFSITKETAGKAGFWNEDGNGNKIPAAEYERKLNIEAYIDEAVEVSIGKGTRKPDAKNHDFARDGWDYRVGYFRDFDGNYYSFKISVGVNGKKNTVYNVNDVKKEAAPINWLKGPEPDPSGAGVASDDSVAEKNGKVNEKYSIKEENTVPAEEGLQEDAELYAQMRESKEAQAALKILQKLYGMATRGDTYLIEGEKEALIEKGAWQKRMPEIMEKIRCIVFDFKNSNKKRRDRHYAARFA